MRPLAWAFLTCFVFCLGWSSFPACGNLESPGTEPAQEIPKESPSPEFTTPPDILSEPSALPESNQEQFAESVVLDENAAVSDSPDGSAEISTGSDGSGFTDVLADQPSWSDHADQEAPSGENSTPDSILDGPPEIAAERVADAAPSLQANSVSLIASFLQNHPQRGLMERTNTPGLWELSLVIPAGNHQLQFRLDHQTPDYGTFPSSATQWPVQGQLQNGGTPFAFSVQRTGLFLVQVHLTSGNFAILPEESPTGVRIEGVWSQQTNQQVPMVAQSNGWWQAEFSVKKGTMTWQLALQFSAGWKTYGAIYPVRGVLPQGGTLHLNGSPNVADMPHDGIYRISYRPLEHAFVLQAKPLDGAAHFALLLQDISVLANQSVKMSRIDSFLADMQRASQVPWVSGQKVLFMLRWPQAKAPVYVAGSFNQWSTSQHKMAQVSGTDLYALELSLPVGRHSYKFVDSATTPQWITDPLNPAMEYGGFGPNSVASTEGSTEAELRQHPNFFATQLNNRRTVYVYLPPNYYKNHTFYPVLYMHDGQNLFDPAAFFGGWKVDHWINTLTQQGKMQPTIVVGIANTTGRFDEYTHTQDNIQGQSVGGKAKQYADFLLREVKPWIDGQYRTLPSRRHTSTMGSSLGGLISLWLGYHHSDVFFRIGALSSTFGWGKLSANNPTLLDIAQQEPPKNLVIYVDSGSPNDNYQDTLKMRDILQKKGYQFGLHLQHWVETGAIHNEKAWHDRLFRPLEFLGSWP